MLAFDGGPLYGSSELDFLHQIETGARLYGFVTHLAPGCAHVQVGPVTVEASHSDVEAAIGKAVQVEIVSAPSPSQVVESPASQGRVRGVLVPDDRAAWEIFGESHKPGDLVECVVVGGSAKGIVVRIGPLLGGILRHDYTAFESNASIVVGDLLTAAITIVNPSKGILLLSAERFARADASSENAYGDVDWLSSNTSYQVQLKTMVTLNPVRLTDHSTTAHEDDRDGEGTTPGAAQSSITQDEAEQLHSALEDLSGYAPDELEEAALVVSGGLAEMFLLLGPPPTSGRGRNDDGFGPGDAGGSRDDVHPVGAGSGSGGRRA